MQHSFLEGNEAIAWGAVKAGCRFFAGYPITPATTIFNHMMKLLPPRGGICMQGEDEIASIGFCLGAAMTGEKVMTATSGPGISLFSENISFAIGSEIPIVIVDVQRLGPSTGSATRGADGDIQFLRWGNSGGLPLIVLAPVDVRDCLVLTAHAFNLAESYRCPVFIAANKEISMTRESIDLTGINLPEIVDRQQASEHDPFLPFQKPDQGFTPAFLPIGDKRLVRQTSSTHGPEGYITTDPRQIRQNQKRLYDKVATAVERFTFHEMYGKPEADTLVVTYGITARAAREAVIDLQKDDISVSLLVLKTVWPVPVALISQIAEGSKKIIVIEMNTGQYVREIRRVLTGQSVSFWGQMNGELIAPVQIKEVIAHG